jgi:hypothetical protein
MADAERLSPGQIATRLFGLAPDRDERAPQLCQEALLTLAMNGYEHATGAELRRAPKRERFGLRSLALGHNFLAGRADGRVGVVGEMTPQLYGEKLAAGEDLPGSANLALARAALEGLIDPDTRKGQPGGWLLLPFHESLLWYDARRQGSRGKWGVRRVWMRGSGVTLARLLVDPPAGAGGETRALGAATAQALRETLRAPSPLADVADGLERPLEELPEQRQAAEDEAWRLGGEAQLEPLAERLCRHAEGIMLQGGASGPAKLWQLRSIMALDLALHALNAAWDATDTAEEQRYLLLSFTGPPRRDNRVRQRSEASYDTARIRLREAILRTLAQAISELAAEGAIQWQAEFVSRKDQLADQIRQLEQGAAAAELERIAREVVAIADYGRPVGGFQGLLQTAGLLAGTGQYRYIAPNPELLAALVGALSARMPMSSDDLFDAMFSEWGLVVGQRAAARTTLGDEIDGAELERNARRAEQQLADSGLAVALSDRTTVVGERARRSR